jgi:hypothetical protein
MGPAVWEFCWLIEHESRDDGKVLNGQPFSIQRIAEELGERMETVKANLARLEEQGYIARQRTEIGDVYSFKIRNSKKWRFAGTQNGTVQTHTQMRTQTETLIKPQNCASPARYITNAERRWERNAYFERATRGLNLADVFRLRGAGDPLRPGPGDLPLLGGTIPPKKDE